MASMKSAGFCAAGKTYSSMRFLTFERIHPKLPLYRDCYGRRVLRFDVRYPCFDEFDATNENRYSHDYYIETPEGYVQLCFADGQDGAKVNGPYDAEYLEWEYGGSMMSRVLLREAGLIDKDDEELRECARVIRESFAAMDQGGEEDEEHKETLERYKELLSLLQGEGGGEE